MPTISSFYGITIVMHLRDKEHNPPHIHAVMQECSAVFRIKDGEMMEGYLPPRGMYMVKDFIELNRAELEEMWETGIYRKLPPLK